MPPKAVTPLSNLQDAKRIPFVKVFKDRHGTTRRYYRRKGFATVPLAGEPGTAEFRASYEAATGHYIKASKSSARACYIYAIQVRGFDLVKIGYSDSPVRRIEALAKGAGMAGGLDMLISFRARRVLERQLHKQFEDQRLFGEWFRLSGPIEEWIARRKADAADLRARLAA